MRLFSIFFFTFCTFCNILFAQKIQNTFRSDSVKFNNRKYKQELGLGVNRIFQGYVGSNLIWKVRDDHAKLVPVSYSDYWRFQAGIGGYGRTGKRDTIQTVNGDFTITYPSYTNNNVFLRIGRERNNFSNRFNFFYGWDAGLDFGYQKNNYYFDEYLGGIPVYYGELHSKYSATRFGLGGALFFGIKYHFTDRISLSVESGFDAAYSLIRNKVSIRMPDGLGTSDPFWQHSFSYGFNYLRFVTLNYHFKQY